MGKGKITVVLPMAGRGSRFTDKGFEMPKPLIKVAGVPMVVRSLGSLNNANEIRLIVVALKSQEHQFKIEKLLNSYGYKPEMILIDEVTQGQLCTVLKAENLLEENTKLLIIPSDTFVKSNIIKEIENLDDSISGLISVYNLPGDRWSFAKLGEQGNVIEVAEKVRISDFASTGIYFFNSSSEFIKYGKEMVVNNELTNNEFYVIPIYNKFIMNGGIVKLSLANAVFDMGTPEAKAQYEEYLKNENIS
jgi:NDP-sugar pyrophosphorylase family protein